MRADRRRMRRACAREARRTAFFNSSTLWVSDALTGISTKPAKAESKADTTFDVGRQSCARPLSIFKHQSSECGPRWHPLAEVARRARGQRVRHRDVRHWVEVGPLSDGGFARWGEQGSAPTSTTSGRRSPCRARDHEARHGRADRPHAAVGRDLLRLVLRAVGPGGARAARAAAAVEAGVERRGAAPAARSASARRRRGRHGARGARSAAAGWTAAVVVVISVGAADEQLEAPTAVLPRPRATLPPRSPARRRRQHRRVAAARAARVDRARRRRGGRAAAPPVLLVSAGPPRGAPTTTRPRRRPLGPRGGGRVGRGGGRGRARRRRGALARRPLTRARGLRVGGLAAALAARRGVAFGAARVPRAGRAGRGRLAPTAARCDRRDRRRRARDARGPRAARDGVDDASGASWAARLGLAQRRPARARDRRERAARGGARLAPAASGAAPPWGERVARTQRVRVARARVL